MNQLGELGFNVWDVEFGDHSTALERERNALLISGYFESNIGQLNTLINSDFYLDDEQDRVAPPIQYEEKAIFTQLYLKDYMNKQARNILRNAASSSNGNVSTSSSSTTDGVTDWIELREGDTSIRRSVATSTSKNTSAQIFQKSAAEANQLLKELVHSYNMFGAVPLQVAGKDAPHDELTYIKAQPYDVELEIQKIRNQFKLLTESFVSHNKEMEDALEAVKNDIKESNIEGFTKTYTIQKNADELIVDWSNEFFPSLKPTVLASLKSSNPDDPIVAYRIDGDVTNKGVKLVFSSNLSSDHYTMDIAAFVTD